MTSCRINIRRVPCVRLVWSVSEILYHVCKSQSVVLDYNLERWPEQGHKHNLLSPLESCETSPEMNPAQQTLSLTIQEYTASRADGSLYPVPISRTAPISRDATSVRNRGTVYLYEDFTR